MPRKHAVIRRDETIRSILLGLFVLVAAIAIVLSDRALFIGRRSLVLAGRAVAAGGLPPDYARLIDDYGIHILRLGRRPLLSLDRKPAAAEPVVDGSTPVRFGYSVRETSVAGLPFWVGTEHGHVLYYETPREYVIAPVTDDYLRRLKIAAPGPLDDGDFPRWPHMWGWLFVVALAGIGLFEAGAANRRRTALGMI